MEVERRVAERTAALVAEVQRLTAQASRLEEVERELQESQRRFALDLYERRRAEAVLQESDERWQLAIRGTNDGIWDWNGRTKEVFISTRWKEMLGFEDHEISGPTLNWTERLHPDDREAVWQLVRNHHAQRTPFFVAEYRIRCKDGTYKWVIDRGHSLWDEAGNVIRMVGSQTDITERKRLEAEREREHRKLEALFQNAPVGIFEEDPEGHNVRANPRLCDILGFTPERLRGEGWISVVHPEDRERVAAEWSSAAAEGRAASLEFRSLRAGGEVRWLSRRSVVLRDENGTHTGFIGTIEDITERKKAAEALALTNEDLERRVEERTADLRREEARRELVALENERLCQKTQEAVEARDEFLSIASHELRTPLTALTLQLQSLRRLLATGHPDDRAPAKLDLALRQTERLTKLIDNLLEVSRITTGRLELNPEDCDLAEVIGDVTARLTDEAARAGCEIAVRAWAPVSGQWDRLRIEQVVVNLLSNAIKYAPGKPIEVEVGEDGEDARVIVRDHGPGIAPVDEKRIFGRFQRAASTRHYGGLGLGLYITTQILEAHGATITVERPPGGGARFTVTLPRRVA